MRFRCTDPFDLGTQSEIFSLTNEPGKPFDLTRQSSTPIHLGLEAIKGSLTGSLSPAAVDRWITSRNAYLYGRRPIEALLDGDRDAVDGALEVFNAGHYL